ncbi:uncharacterized protein BX664DRAFT_341337 [Halteromyces radiatus]|nr:uncharacterized protein BX664DRAFT_341337 [Halteromyces radiatus]KAI8079731.1 hypothetical protein BX664DRAFT_341337 [Halteromyces radiatus]
MELLPLLLFLFFFFLYSLFDYATTLSFLPRHLFSILTIFYFLFLRHLIL